MGVPVQIPVAGDFGGAFGAARLGYMAATEGGVEIASAPPVAETYDPEPALFDTFNEGHSRYKQAQAALGGLT